VANPCNPPDDRQAPVMPVANAHAHARAWAGFYLGVLGDTYTHARTLVALVTALPLYPRPNPLEGPRP
jgi:hypothetical protein